MDLMHRLLLSLAASLFVFSGNAPRAMAPGPTVLSADLSPLRARFNADAGKVRAIFLASPT